MNTECILLIGCGEHSRVVIDNIEDIGGIEIVGLIGKDKDEVGKKVNGYEIIGTDSDIEDIFNSEKYLTGYFLAMGQLGKGNMSPRYEMIRKLSNAYRTINLIHPNSSVSKYCKLGNGILLEAYTRVAGGAVVGNFTIVNSFSAINHDQIIGDNVLIAGNVSMAGTRIGNNTILADGSSIAFKKSVGSNCIIGDGAVVTRDIPDNSVAYGNPARIIRRNSYFD